MTGQPKVQVSSKNIAMGPKGPEVDSQDSISAMDTQVQTATGTSGVKQTASGATLLAKKVQELIRLDCWHEWG